MCCFLFNLTLDQYNIPNYDTLSYHKVQNEWRSWIQLKENWFYQVLYMQLLFITINFCRSSLKSVVVLLPLLSITWIIGVLTFNQQTTLFHWLFTIFNSIQVSTMKESYYSGYILLSFIGLCCFIPSCIEEQVCKSSSLCMLVYPLLFQCRIIIIIIFQCR